MQLSERIVRYYTDRNHGRKKVFLVSLRELEELLSLDKVGELNVVRVDSQEVADRYTLQREGHGEIRFEDGTVFPPNWFYRVKVESGHFYVLDTRKMEKPQDFCQLFLPERYYHDRWDTTSCVAAIKEHLDEKQWCSDWIKFSAVIQDLSEPNPYSWK